ncbi:putative metalloprotease with PDZ domain [Ulvibacter sp. MAR_2010_11]|uniref:M61 family metallopeptidase n=1 Tax=Ulvibacter sp. MAR_2010_11 TaxID=1250229 RepID=UPI000C2CB887|nr:peptidase M61 [Ulvibacter sp. MAR_2010_11]PKA84152.1 putative metalloprotease with PDZ domain [Ulvibacter sp. MAR_2010_11]
MKRIIYTLGLAALLVSCGPASTSINDFGTTTPIVTSLDLTKVVNDKVPVTINPGRFSQEVVTYRIPKVVQGTYAVSDFGNFIDDFKALDYKGNALAVSKTDTNTWTIANATQLDKITYYVNDTFDVESEGKSPFSPSGTNIAPDNYVLNLHGFIGYFDSLKNGQYTVDVTAPSDFVRSSALQNTGEKLSDDGKVSTTSYFAPRYFDITDNPMMYGKLDVEEFLVGDIKVVLSVYSPNKTYTAADLKGTMFKMMQGQKKYLGDINSTPRYDIFLYLSDGKEDSPQGFGALEHHTSTVVVMPESAGAESLAKSMTDVVAHEFFHIVTPLSVHSEDVHYFDYNNPTFSKHLWMYEGVTEYFAHHFQIYEGLISEDQFYKTLIEKIDTSRQMDDSMSFTVMSENVLGEPYASNYYNVYQKGALIGMCIDILMREESNGNRSMLSLMKELSAKYGENKPFTDDTIIQEIGTMTYPSVAEFLKTHVEGTTPIDYSKFFQKAGLIEVEGQVESNFVLQGGTPIVSGSPDRGIFFSNLVENNTFWNNVGAKPNDVIKTVNGTDVTLQNANNVFMEMYGWELGKDIEVVLDREGEDVLIKTVTTQPYTTGKKLVVNPEATAAQTALRKAWLKG